VPGTSHPVPRRGAESLQFARVLFLETISFSYGRALQDAALHAWHGKAEQLKAGQQAFHHRAKCNGAAALGKYTDALEGKGTMVAASAGMTELHDD
jgi:fructose-bisphosphate aldolase class I